MVEDQVTEEVRKLEDGGSRRAQIPEAKLTSALHDYVADYKRIMQQHPLAENLVASTNMPRFGPVQMPLGGVQQPGGEGIPNSGAKIASAKVPAPKNVAVMADRGSVLPPSTDPSQPRSRHQGRPGRCSRWTRTGCACRGDIPWGDYVNYFKGLPADQKLPDENQHNVLYKVEVERRARTATGWTTWAPVPATSAGGDEADSGD